MLYAGIDLGTSSVKLLLCDEKGNIVNQVTEEYPLSIPRDGYSEQNPEDWYEKTLKGLKTLVGSRGSELKAVSFGGQMHTLVMLDEKDEVIRPAILWNDGRSTQECEYLNSVIGKEKLAEYTANIAFAGFTAPKLLWCAKNEPENFSRLAKIMLPKDYINYRLSGEFVTEPSDASGTLLFDVKNKSWSKEMADICGIDTAMLPSVRSSSEPCGFLKKEIADALGAKNVVIAPGAGDNAASAIGMGLVGGGKCCISVGTSGTVFITSDNFTPSVGNALHSFAHADGGYHLLGCVLSAAGCNKWWIEDILDTSDYEKEQRGIENLGENEVIFLPHLSGERSPHNNPLARGVFANLSLASSRRDMTLAVMEGVAYALRECVEAARSGEFSLGEAFVCGGGMKSPLWRKILANVLRLKLNIPACGEGASYGAAILAMKAAGEYASLKEAAENIVKVKSTVRFDEAAAEKYDCGFEKFKDLYNKLYR